MVKYIYIHLLKRAPNLWVHPQFFCPARNYLLCILVSFCVKITLKFTASPSFAPTLFGPDWHQLIKKSILICCFYLEMMIVASCAYITSTCGWTCDWSEIIKNRIWSSQVENINVVNSDVRFVSNRIPYQRLKNATPD